MRRRTGIQSKAFMKALRAKENSPERRASRALGLLAWEYRNLKQELGREPTREDVVNMK